MLESLFNKVECHQASNFMKKRLQHRYFPEKLTIKTPILKNIWEQLLLISNDEGSRNYLVVFQVIQEKVAQPKKCQYSELFWTVFFLIRTEYREIVSLRIQSECGKMRTRITPNTDTFHAVLWFVFLHEDV